MLAEMPSSVQVAILEILFHFANYCEGEPWSADLRAPFLDALPLFRQLSTSTDEDVSDYSRMIIEKLRADE